VGFPPTAPTARHVTIVAEVGHQLVGLLVEGVSDILTVPRDEIRPIPDVASAATKRCVTGVISLEQRLISIIGIDAVLPDKVAQAA
jgi:purine-binding chemotaxis protein CheW